MAAANGRSTRPLTRTGRRPDWATLAAVQSSRTGEPPTAATPAPEPGTDPRPPAVIARALAAYATLRSLGESVEDEWLYVTELERTWRERLLGLADALGEAPLPAPAVDAVAEAIAEIALIRDPHRAIDWLSTFPQVVAVALGPHVPAAI